MIFKCIQLVDQTQRLSLIHIYSSLSIKTSGLLGEQYIALSMGFDDGETAMLKNGSQIQDTKSAMVLEDLIGQFLYGDKKSDGNADKAESDVK